MTRPALQWTLAIVITLASAVWQRTTGPTYPVRGSVRLGGADIHLKLERSHSISSRQPVTVRVQGNTTVAVQWRRFPSDAPWQFAPMTRQGDVWEAMLPPSPEPLMPPAGKLEYRVWLTRLDPGTKTADRAAFPERPAVTRFKGDVPATWLVPHVFAMFFGMLFSSRAALAAIFGGPTRLWSFLTVLLLVVGGFVLGPIVQKAAFGAYWTGIPWGWDLTDDKTLLAGVAWLSAAWQMRGGREGRTAAVVAAVVTLAVFAIPHSVWGSEVKWGG
jgi:hypothetical protein